MVEPLVATSSFSVTVQALARLRVPAAVCQMLLLAYRYIYVFQDEVGRMVKGMSARGFRKRTDVETLNEPSGTSWECLMVRSFERTQRVHDAMLARGYDGAMPSTIEFQMRNTDWMKGAFWVAAGIAILIADKVCRIAPFTHLLDRVSADGSVAIIRAAVIILCKKLMKGFNLMNRRIDYGRKTRAQTFARA